MGTSFEKLGVLVQIAFRNLFASRLKTLIVGGIIFFGTLLVVVGSSMLDSVNDGMSRSIIGSAAGHLQVYSAKSKDDLALFGGGMSEPNLKPIDDFSVIKKSLESVPNVKTVVPMGINGAMIPSGNTIDLVLSRLRKAINQQREGDASQELMEQIGSQKAHVRQMVKVLEADVKNLKTLVDESAANAQAEKDLARASSDEFWAGFDADPLGALEFLENRIAPQTTDADLLWIRYIGTDLDSFQSSFDRMEIVDGTAVPSGQRGLLIPKLFYEDYVKLKNARRLDRIREGLEGGLRTIAQDEELKRFVRENKSQIRELLFQLDPIKTRQATERLQAALPSKESDLGKLLVALFDTTDENFERHYEIFYEQIAPLLELYRIRVGDTLSISAFTNSGYMQSVNVKVYGTFQFKGLEKSALSGSMALMDLMSFRDLYGFLTREKAAELKKLQEGANLADVSRENAEDALFGGGEAVVAEATPGIIDVDAELEGLGDRLRRQEQLARVYSREDLEKGVVLNAAIILKDPELLEETMAEVEAAAKRDGLELKVVNWQKAAGMIGQFILLARIILYTAVLIIFIVALVIINNAMVMATLERVREFGTMRAIGAQKRFVLAMLLVEALVVGLLFGLLGGAVGGGIVKALGASGIPATTDVMFFFFSGPRLHPFVGTSNLVAAFVIVLVVSILSAFYPAWLAMRVSPRQAMQSED